MAEINQLSQCGSFGETRKYSPHRVFSEPRVNNTKLAGVIDGLDVKFLDVHGKALAALNPYDLLVLADGALEAWFTNDGDMVLGEIGQGREEDQ